MQMVPPAGRPGRSVLIIEDNPDQARDLEAILQRAGYATVAIPTGFEGEDAAASDSFDAIVLDLQLPDRDGAEVARNLRRRRVNSVIIMLSCLGSVDRITQALEVGADDYLTKPYDPSELVARLRAKLARAGQSMPWRTLPPLDANPTRPAATGPAAAPRRRRRPVAASRYDRRDEQRP